MTILLTFTAALCASLVLTPVARAVAQRFGIVDRPDGRRKIQPAPVALWGGIAVYCGLCTGLAAASIVRSPGQPVPARLSLLVIISSGLLGLVGLIDDTHNLRARTKLLLQVLAISPLVVAGFFPRYAILLGTEFALSWLGPLIMVFWLVACVNAINLLDGLDGFASVAGIALSAAIAAVGMWSGNFGVSVAALALAGALVGFLPFNLPPASIYLGDAGSMMVGLTLGALCMHVTDITGRSVMAIVPVVIMSVPLWDTAMAILRRRVRGVPIGEGDREHLHHRLLDWGLSNAQALVFVSLLCLSTGAAVLVAIRAEWELLAVLGAVMVVCSLAVGRIFGEDELGLLRRATAAWAVRRAAPLSLPPRYQGIKLKRHLKTLDAEGTWLLLLHIVDHFECSSADVRFSDDSLLSPRSYRRDSEGIDRDYSDRGTDLTIAAVQTNAFRTQCEVSIAFHHSAAHAACNAACFSDVLNAFAEHFLRLLTAESTAPVVHILSTQDDQLHPAQRRVA